MRDENDIKAPDGFLLGGKRRVRKDGTILFQRGWWEIPEEYKADFIGEEVWVHTYDDNAVGERHRDTQLEVARPGLHIYSARGMRPPMTVFATRSNRPDAKAGLRNQYHKAWAERMSAEQAEWARTRTHCKECYCVMLRTDPVCEVCETPNPALSPSPNQ